MSGNQWHRSLILLIFRTMIPRKPAISTVLALVASLAFGAQTQTRTTVERYVAGHQPEIVGELVSLLSIPNVASDKPNIRKNAELLREMLRRRGFAVEILETEVNPLVYGELRVPGASRTILWYAHYDGQPFDAKLWKQESAFKPILRDGRMEDGAKEIPNFGSLKTYPSGSRIYARSASDDKAPIVALLAAIDALRASGQFLRSNVRVLLDGEEEASSRGLISSLTKYREKYGADMMLVLDGPLHSSGKPTVVFGGRGIATLELTVFGPKFALHSGHYGNWAPNPAMDLVQLLGSMKDQNGRVAVEGFYDDVAPLTAEEKRVLSSVPDDPAALMEFFGISRTDKVGGSLQEALQYPSLNIRGLRSAYVGTEVRTVIPESATASIDIRLVKETDPDRMIRRVLDHIRTQGFQIVDKAPDDATRAKYPRIVMVGSGSGGAAFSGTKAYRTEMNDPASVEITNVLQRTWNEEPVRIRTMGGTVPMAPFAEAFGFPIISIPVVNFDNNQHSENENLRLENLWKAIVTFAAVLTM
jgi:acetylornithine deacetylase/succinyl-diaminopimelate desuccinylase-like protein